MDNKLKPAVIGGVVLGILSAIPFVNFVNICCCLWAILGGMLAAHLYVKNSPTPASAGDGAIVGAIAGAVGAVISLIIGIPLSIVSGAAMRGALISLMERADPRTGGNVSQADGGIRRVDRRRDRQWFDWRRSALHLRSHRRSDRRPAFRKAQRWSGSAAAAIPRCRTRTVRGLT